MEMKNKFYFLIGFFIIALSLNVQAQVTISGNRIFAFGETSDLDDIPNAIVELYQKEEIEMKVTDRFPARPNYEVRVSFGNIFGENLKLGGSFNYFSTGSKITYADYSGEINEILVFERKSFEIFLGQPIYSSGNRISVIGTISAGVNFSTVKLNSSLTLYDQSAEENTTFESQSWFSEPALEVQVRLFYGLFIAGTGSVNLNISSQLKNDSGNGLFNSNGKEIQMNTSGPRFKIGLGYTF